MKSVNHYYNRARHKTKHLFFYLTRTSKGYSINKNTSYAVINFDEQLRNWDNSRYFYIACKYLEHAGFKVVVKVDYKDVEPTTRLSYKTPLLKEDFCFVRRCTTPTNSITLFMPNRDVKHIQLTYGHDQLKEAFDCIAPYPMHPNQYKERSSEHITSLRKGEKFIEVFFSGNVDEKLYNRDRLEKKFNVISRHKVIAHIKDHFGPLGKIKILSEETELLQFLILKKPANAIIISEARTRPDEWLNTLSKASFFIAPPGVGMPWAHNVIEAMAVGAIPILQYASLFDPPLVHMENCLSYGSFDELDHVLELALSMEGDTVKRMRNNVIDYFDKYLSIESVINRINVFTSSEKQHISVGVTFIPENSHEVYMVVLDLRLLYVI